MMSVGDHELLIFHRGLYGGGAIGVGDDSQAMHNTIFIMQNGRRSGGLGVLQDRVDALLGIRIEHEKLASVRARMAKKFEAVGLGTGERMLVAEDDASGIFL